MSLVQVKCPSCGTTVWVALGTPCPSCRKTVPTDLLEASAKEAGFDLKASPTPPESRPSPRPDSRIESSAPAATAPAIRPDDSQRRVVYQTYWVIFCIGLMVMLCSGALFFAGDSGTAPSRESRRARSLENAIGKQGTRWLFAGVGVCAGAFMMYASRVKTTIAVGPEDTMHACDLCGRSPPGNGEAFISVCGGGAKEFTAAFRCHSCEGCLQTASRLANRFNIQFSLLLLMIIPALPFPVAGLAFILNIIAPQNAHAEPRPGAAMFFAICFGIAAVLAAAVVGLHFHVSRGTARLLGPRLDPVIRSVAGVRRWRWPRSMSMSRQAAIGQKIIDLS